MNKNKIFVKNTVKLTEKSSPLNIGIDLKAISYTIVGEKMNGFYKSIDYIEYDTGVQLDSSRRNSETQLYSLVYPRSSISNKNLLLCNGVGLIDPNYRDSIKIRFKYIHQAKDLRSFNDFFMIEVDENKIYKIGNKIGQLVFCEDLNIHIEYVPELASSDRTGGFGTTGE